MTIEELIAFEADIAAEFNAGNIPYPVHLSDGNESQLIEIFKEIGPDDWVLGSWRSHYHCLLKGVPPDVLKAEIMAGNSIALCFPEYRILNSAIVGGSIPIALGIAAGIEMAEGGVKQHVFCFMGDMTAMTGIAHECMKYARWEQLPIKFIIEDNGFSVCTDTGAVWGPLRDRLDAEFYSYKSSYPHAGAGVRVQF